MNGNIINGNWKTIATIFAIIISVGSVVASHFNGIQAANDYADKRIQEFVPVLNDIHKLLYTISVKVAVIEEKVISQEKKEERKRNGR